MFFNESDYESVPPPADSPRWNEYDEWSAPTRDGLYWYRGFDLKPFALVIEDGGRRALEEGAWPREGGIHGWCPREPKGKSDG